MAYAFQQIAASAQKNSQSLINPLVLKLEPKEVVLLRMLLQNGGVILSQFRQENEGREYNYIIKSLGTTALLSGN